MSRRLRTTTNQSLSTKEAINFQIQPKAPCSPTHQPSLRLLKTPCRSSITTNTFILLLFKAKSRTSTFWCCPHFNAKRSQSHFSSNFYRTLPIMIQMLNRILRKRELKGVIEILSVRISLWRLKKSSTKLCWTVLNAWVRAWKSEVSTLSSFKPQACLVARLTRLNHNFKGHMRIPSLRYLKNQPIWTSWIRTWPIIQFMYQPWIWLRYYCHQRMIKGFLKL